MSKTFILETEEAETLPVRKWKNITGNHIKLKNVDFIKWVPILIWPYSANLEARIKNHDIFEIRIKWAFKKCQRLLFYTFLKLKNKRNARWLMFCGTPCRSGLATRYWHK